ncbi:MAG: hypothetical protein K1X89_19020 [Myxococcaceae bacterium]|nr:hypothetical protein [Myxococcaceae bacterium]
MRSSRLVSWVLSLAVSSLARAASPDDFGVAACRRGNDLEVWTQISQDEGGTTTSRGRYSLRDGGQRWESLGWPPPPVEGGQLEDGGLVWPAMRNDGSLDWGDPGCASLRPVRLRLDGRLFPSPLSADFIAALERDGLAQLRGSDLWRQPLERRLELSADGGVVARLDLSLARNDVTLEGYDVGDRRHLLLLATWIFSFNEGAPVPDLAVRLVPLDASSMRTARDGGEVLVVRLPGVRRDDDGWTEVTRLASAAAQALEARHSPRAAEFRALAKRRERQQVLARSRAFARAQAACTETAVNMSSAGPERWQPLVDAVFALHAATRPADWPLVVERLEWAQSTCGDALEALPLDGGTTLTLYGHPYSR